MPIARSRRSPRQSLPAALASLGIVGTIAAGLVLGLGMSLSAGPQSALQSILFALPPPPPPPPPPAHSPRAAPRPAGHAAAHPAPPVPLIPLALPLPFMPFPTPAAGTANLPGPGTGAGASGSGAGGGGTGGNGAGAAPGPAVPAVQIAGRLSAHDLPHDVLPPGGSLAVGVAYTVSEDGRVRDCTITASSGFAEIDMLVCRLLTSRFRYRPARDSAGHPVPTPVRETHAWARREDRPASAR